MKKEDLNTFNEKVEILNSQGSQNKDDKSKLYNDFFFPMYKILKLIIFISSVNYRLEKLSEYILNVTFLYVMPFKAEE